MKKDIKPIKVEQKYSVFLLMIKQFFTLKIKAYSHQTLNTSKEVVRSQEQSFCSVEEISKNERLKSKIFGKLP